MGNEYPIFIEKAKEDFKEDRTYLEIKKEINSSRLFPSTEFYQDLFDIFSFEEIKNFISTKEDYQKLFWHLYSYDKLDKKYFINLSNSFLNELLDLSIQSIQLSLKQSKYEEIKNFYQIKNLLETFNLYNRKSLSPLIIYVSNIDKEIYKNLSKSSKNNLLSLLELDKTQNLFIKRLMLTHDRDNIYYYEFS